MKKFIIFALVLSLMVGMLASCSQNFIQEDLNVSRLSIEDADLTLDSYINQLSYEIKNPPIDLETSTKYVDEMPDINAAFQLSVVGKNQVNIEIWVSTERSGDGNDGWINRVTEKFNALNMKLADGRTISVSIRSIDAGAQLDYLTLTDKRPDAWSPANTLWNDMATTRGVISILVLDRTVGNTAGFLLSKNRYKDYMTRHAQVNWDGIITDAENDLLIFGWTNVFTSDTALNGFSDMFISLDPKNPLSAANVERFINLQKKAPPPAYTTAQMRESAKKGFVDAMVMECQAYSNEPTLADFEFIPFGVRHDNPVYKFPNMPADREEVLNLWIEYITNDESQKLGTQMGFNKHNDYVGTKSLNGTELYSAQALWKTNKSGGKPTIAIFVADTSGSMGNDGRLTMLKQSLLTSMPYIGEDAHIGMVSYNHKFAVELELAKFEGAHRGKFQSAVKNLNASGDTHIYSGILIALKMIRDYQKAGIDGNYMIFLLTDGQLTGGVKEEVLAQLIVSFGIPVHTIGYTKDADQDLLKRLSRYNEGFNVQVDENNVGYNFKNMFNSQT